MKICKYEKCNVVHNKRGSYCKPSHKTRQWELTNGRQNPVKKFAPARLKKPYNPLTDILSKPIESSGISSIQVPQKQYRTVLVKRNPKPYISMIMGGSAFLINMMNGKGFLDSLDMGLELGIKGLAVDIVSNALIGNTKEVIEEIQPSITQYGLDKYLSNRESKSKPNSDTTSTRINSRDYRKLNIPTIKFDREFRPLLGVPPENFYMLVHGQSGHGKTYWTIRFAEYFERNHGSVIYYAAEQRGNNLAFQNMLNEIESTFQVEKEPMKLSKERIISDLNNYDLVVFDSFNHMNLTPEDIRDFRKAGNAAVVGILQSTKDGKFKGDNTWLHDADMMVQLVNRVANSEAKQRYESRGSKTINIDSRKLN